MLAIVSVILEADYKELFAPAARGALSKY